MPYSHEGNDYLQSIYPNWDKTNKTKTQTEVRQALEGVVHFVVAMENTSNPRCQLIHM